VLFANFVITTFASSKVLPSLYPKSLPRPSDYNDDLSEMVRPKDVDFKGPNQYGEMYQLDCFIDSLYCYCDIFHLTLCLFIVHVLGQYHPVESPELIAWKLIGFHIKLASIHSDKKLSVLTAEKHCPELLTDDFKLMFLRCEVFHAHRAALRYVAYWKKRHEIFGEKAFEPITLATHMRSSVDKVALANGLFNLFEVNGRIVSFECMHTFCLDQTTRESYLKVLWYLIHVALENIETQKKGIIALNYPRGVDILKQKDLTMVYMFGTLKGVAPIHLSAYHCCHPPKWTKAFLPFVHLILGKRLSQRIVFHSGSDEDVLKCLQRYGFSKEDLPIEVGGEKMLSMTTFYETRRNGGL